MLINLDINEQAVFDAVWDVVKSRDAFDICIFKGRYNKNEFRSFYYNSLNSMQKAS